MLPVPERRFRYPGRKRYPEWACLEGILTVLRWGIPWRELPQRPAGRRGRRVGAVLISGSGPVSGRNSSHSCSGWPRRASWIGSGRCSTRRSWTPKRGATIGKSPVNRGRPSTKLHLVCDGRGVPLALVLGPGNRHDCVHALAAVDAVPCLRLRRRGARTGQRAARRPRLRRRLAPRGAARARHQTADPRTQTRNRRVRDAQARQRWPIERTNAWLHNQRRLNPRWERRDELYLAFAQLAAALILCRRLNNAF